jgi:CheY-like chemotaxis protein
VVLEDSGDYEVRVENEPTNALDTAKGFEPDLIILDVLMPKMSGIQLAAKIQEDPRLSKTPIIFLTATASRNHPAEHHELLRECMVLAKPITADQLQESIETTLDKQG